MYVWRTLAEGTQAPAGFTVGEATFQGETVQAAVGRDGNLKMLYGTDANGQNGTFYVLNPDGQTLSAYVNLTSGAQYTIIQPDLSLIHI